jgi:two-component system, LuxR family, sensor kinase FixL
MQPDPSTPARFPSIPLVVAAGRVFAQGGALRAPSWTSAAPAQAVFPARDLLIGALATAICLLPAALLPALIHSAYMFGAVAVMITVAIARPPGVALSVALVLVAGLLIDTKAGLPAVEYLSRAALASIMGATLFYWTRKVRSLQQASDAAVADLAEKEAFLRSVLDTGPDAMLVIDQTGAVLTFGASAEALFGWSAEEVLGKNVISLLPSPYREDLEAYIARYLESADRKVIAKSREVAGLRKDGSRFPMVIHVGEVRVGSERNFTCFVRDMTVLNEARSRTDQLRNQLTHVWRMNSLGEIGAVLAHELNQPLSAITNYVRGAGSIVRRLDLDKEGLLEALTEAGGQAIRAGEIIRRIRGMLAPQADERRTVSLADLILEVDAMMSLIAREAEVTLQYDLDHVDDDVRVDQIQIQQVIANLVRNAVDAMKGHETRILEIASVRSGDDWRVRVSDSGPGVAPEVIGQLFEPLVSTKDQGMGLGLTISRTIVEGHGGAIWVEASTLGGASFCFSLPAGGGGLRHRMGADG